MTKTLVHEHLLALGLRATAERLDDLTAQALTHRWSPVQLLEHVIGLELDERARKSRERRLARSKLGRFKPMADFDWAWPKRLDKKLMEAALGLDFLTDNRNVVIVAPQGLGKTMLAQNIGYQAAVAGHVVRFVTAAELLLDLGAQDSARGLERRLRYWSGIKLLIIDELRYLSYDTRNADLLFQVVSRRYERRSLVLTTNLSFKEWPTIFPNAACTTALIDRIVHHADIIVLEGDSYRRREAEETRSARRSSARGERG